ncbi:MAG TPA: alkaline phosphatase family protein [Myxococcota bacterium]|nr:alkaline phosphatase family protein [Myxococcota bacterium]
MGWRTSRRGFLRAGATAGLGLLGARLGLDPAAASAFGWRRRRPLRQPGSLPYPHLPAGTDTLPQIEHIIVVMMENHSYDNYLGMLHRGDGFVSIGGRPLNANPDGQGDLIRAFHMPATCQPDDDGPSQSWNASHISYDDGRNDGFVLASGGIAMGYWDRNDLPFYYGLASTFPVCDRWFCSVLAQTYPNRRFLLAGTAAGLVATDPNAILKGPEPPNGSIFTRLDDHQISWIDYASDIPQLALFPSVFHSHAHGWAPIDRFFTAAAAGTLPSVSYVDPPFLNPIGSEENGDIHVGEDFVARVVNAAMQGPAWPKTLLIWLYDEHGGYYDHVPPPRAVAPDDIPPEIQVPPDQPGGYDRYGFRVPAAIVSPYARRNYVSHVVHDHTSVLKLIETKWNLPALTFRDANADDLLDSLDLHGEPAFLEPPVLPPSALSTGASCEPIDPSEIPPASAVLQEPRRPHNHEVWGQIWRAHHGKDGFQ